MAEHIVAGLRGLELHTLLEVEWVDAGLENGQLSPGEAGELRCLSRSNIGYYLGSENDSLKVAFSKIYDADKNLSAVQDIVCIPLGNVIGWKRLLTGVVNDDHIEIPPPGPPETISKGL